MKIMNKFLILLTPLLLLLLLLGCKEEIQSLPLNEEKLGKILIDVHVAEAAMQRMVGPKKDSLRELYYDQIFEIHGVSQTSFEESMSLLTQNPRRLRFFYENLIDEIEKEKANRNPKRKTRTFSKPNPDSLSQE